MPVLSTALTRVVSKKGVTRQELNQVYNVDTYLDGVLDQLIIEVERFVASDHPKNIYWEVEYPASWWQHFKRDVLRPLTDNPSTPVGWWLAEKARSILYKREAFRESYVTRTCPHIEVPHAKQTHLEWLVDDGAFVK